MIAIGVLLILIGLVIYFFCGTYEDTGEKNGHWVRASFCLLGGVVLCLGLILIIPPIKERENEDFTVTTKSRCNVQTEIFINKDKTSDTTFYYNFKNATVKATE